MKKNWFRREWVNKEGNYVTKDFIDYVKPLIQGDYQPIMVNGLPRHLVLDMKRNNVPKFM